MARYESWPSCQHSIGIEGGALEIAPWIRSVTASDAAETALVRGSGRDILGTTDPQYAPGEGSLEVLWRPMRVWMRSITNDGAIALGDLDLVLQVQAGARGLEPLPDEILCQITGLDDSQTQGSADPLVVTVALQIRRITRNGVRL